MGGGASKDQPANAMDPVVPSPAPKKCAQSPAPKQAAPSVPARMPAPAKVAEPLALPSGAPFDGPLHNLSVAELKAIIDVCGQPQPAGMLEKADLVAFGRRCIGPPEQLRPNLLKRLIEATGHDHTGCAEKGELVACLRGAIEAGGRVPLEAARFAAQAEEIERRRAEDEAVAQAEQQAQLRWRAEETAKARAMLEAADIEEEERRIAAEEASAERLRLEERKAALQVAAAEHQVQMAQARLALEKEQRVRTNAERAALEAELRAAKGATQAAQAAEGAHAAEAELAKLRLDESMQQVSLLTAELERLRLAAQKAEENAEKDASPKIPTLADANQQQLRQILQMRHTSRGLSAEDEALYADVDAFDPEGHGEFETIHLDRPPGTARTAPPHEKPTASSSARTPEAKSKSKWAAPIMATAVRIISNGPSSPHSGSSAVEAACAARPPTSASAPAGGKAPPPLSAGRAAASEAPALARPGSTASQPQVGSDLEVVSEC